MGLQSETPADGRDRGRERDNDRDRARDRDRDRESTDRVVKKRASQACHNCRTRKVKCDLVAAGIPCSNCKADNVECIVIESRRSRKYRLQKRRLNGLVSLPPLSQAPPKLTTESSLASGSVSSDATNNAESIPGVVVPSQTSPGTLSSMPCVPQKPQRLTLLIQSYLDGAPNINHSSSESSRRHHTCCQPQRPQP